MGGRPDPVSGAGVPWGREEGGSGRTFQAALENTPSTLGSWQGSTNQGAIPAKPGFSSRLEPDVSSQMFLISH